MPQVNFKLGQLDITLQNALTAADLDRMIAWRTAECSEQNALAIKDFVIGLLWKCAHASNPSVTLEMIKENLVLPDGLVDVMAALAMVTGPVSTDATVN